MHDPDDSGVSLYHGWAPSSAQFFLVLVSLRLFKPGNFFFFSMSLILSPLPSPLQRNTFFELFSPASAFFNLKFPFGSSMCLWFLSLNFLLLFSHLFQAHSQLLTEAASLWQLHCLSMIPASVTPVLTRIDSPVLIPFEICPGLALISDHPLTPGHPPIVQPSVSAGSSDPSAAGERGGSRPLQPPGGNLG